MPVSGFSHGDGAKQSAKRSPWAAIWTPGVNLANFFNLYDSRGNVTISTPTSITSTLDGPIQVVRYGALTINAALTAAQRCRGLYVLCNTLAMGASGVFSMDFLGASGSKNWALDRPIYVPTAIRFTGKATSYSDFLKWIGDTGYCIFDPSLYACPPPGMGDVQCDWPMWSSVGGALVSAAGCGAGGAAQRAGGGYYVAGNPGGAGSNAPGGGGGGGAGSGASSQSGWGGYGGKGWQWSGGSPATGAYENIALNGEVYGGPSAGGLRPGGVGFIICRGAASLTAGHAFTARGDANTSAYCASAGGGRIGLIHAGALTGTFNGTASAGTTAGNYSSVGGAGTANARDYAFMGWS